MFSPSAKSSRRKSYSDNELTSAIVCNVDKKPNIKTLKRFTLIVVSIAVFLDGLLNMIILPIIPQLLANYFPKIEKTNASKSIFDYDRSEVAVGFLFATKPFVQLLINPFSGTLIDHIGYEIPMIIGLAIQFSSTMVFTYCNSFQLLYLARALQGVGSALADTSGFSMIADCFKEQNERSKALGIVITCLAIGSFMSVPISGFLFEYVDKKMPFIALASLALFDLFLLLLNEHLKCTYKKKNKNCQAFTNTENKNQKNSHLDFAIRSLYSNLFSCLDDG